MRTREIPCNEWPAFFEQFSRLHHRKPATLCTMARDLGVQSNARDLPLMGVTGEARGSIGQEIEIMLGEAPNAHLVHTITRPTRVRVAEWNDTYSAALQVDSGGGVTTLLRVGPESEVLEAGVVMDDFDIH